MKEIIRHYSAATSVLFSIRRKKKYIFIETHPVKIISILSRQDILFLLIGNMALELYNKAFARTVIKSLYSLINVGTSIFAQLIRAAINYLTRKNIVNTAELQLDKSIFRDLSVLQKDDFDR